MNAKGTVVLTTLNAIDEMTGGGMYARQLLSFCMELGKTQVICKKNSENNRAMLDDNCIIHAVPKTALSDIFSRLLGSPSFLMFYLFSIVKRIRRSKYIVFQNSRNGWLVLIARLVCWDATVIIAFDNIETDVARSYLDASLLRRIVGTVDYLELLICQTLAYRYADLVLFITEADRDRFAAGRGSKARSMVFPFSLPDTHQFGRGNLLNKGCIRVLFTASFSYPPNQRAIEEFNRIAALYPRNFEFIAAGRAAKDFHSSCPNLTIVSDPDDAEMQALFAASHIYLSPVCTGGGMKTKIAEALRAGLPVIASPESLIGYEATIGSHYVVSYHSDVQLHSALCKMVETLRRSDGAPHRENRDLFLANYALKNSISKVVRNMMEAGLITA